MLYVKAEGYLLYLWSLLELNLDIWKSIFRIEKSKGEKFNTGYVGATGIGGAIESGADGVGDVRVRIRAGGFRRFGAIRGIRHQERHAGGTRR